MIQLRSPVQLLPQEADSILDSKHFLALWVQQDVLLVTTSKVLLTTSISMLKLTGGQRAAIGDLMN